MILSELINSIKTEIDSYFDSLSSQIEYSTIDYLSYQVIDSTGKLFICVQFSDMSIVRVDTLSTICKFTIDVNCAAKSDLSSFVNTYSQIIFELSQHLMSKCFCMEANVEFDYDENTETSYALIRLRVGGNVWTQLIISQKT